MENFQNAVEAIQALSSDPITQEVKTTLMNNLIEGWTEVAELYSAEMSNIASKEVILSEE